MIKTAGSALRIASAAVLTISLSGCFSTIYANKHDKPTYSIALTDNIYGMVMPAKTPAKSPSVIFLGNKHSYLVTQGGQALIELAKTPFAAQINLSNSSVTHRLFMNNGKFYGSMKFVIKPPVNAHSPGLAYQLYGFKPENAGNHDQAKDAVPHAYYRVVNVQGRVGQPFRQPRGTFAKPLKVAFWRVHTSDAWKHSAGHAGAVALDILTAPLQAVGVISGIAIYVMGCSLSSSNCD